MIWVAVAGTIVAAVAIGWTLLRWLELNAPHNRDVDR